MQREKKYNKKVNKPHPSKSANDTLTVWEYFVVGGEGIGAVLLRRVLRRCKQTKTKVKRTVNNNKRRK